MRRRWIALGAITAAAGLVAAFAGAKDDSAKRRSSVKYVPARHAVVAIGSMDVEFERSVLDAIRRHADAKVLVIHSTGGMRSVAFNIAAELNRRDMAAQVHGTCASACALLWAGTKQRQMTQRSRIGLHRSRLGGLLPDAVEVKIAARNDEKTAAVLRAAGFPPSYIERGRAAKTSEMEWFTPSELADGGVIFKLVETKAARRDRP